MGLITGLLTLPLAPVRGVTWIAEALAKEAYEQSFSEAAVRRQLAAAQLDLEAGRLSEDEFELIEDELIDRLVAARRGEAPDRVGGHRD